MAKKIRKTPLRAESAEAYAPAWNVPRSADELHEWLRQHAKLDLPRGALIDGHTAPFEYLVHTFFDWTPVREAPKPAVAAPKPRPIDCVVWANRGGGKTFLGAVATMLDLVFKPGIEVRILGGSMDQSRRMHAHLRRLFERPALAGLVSGRTTERRLRLVNGSEVELLAQSQVSVRGTRVQKLRCDEVELFDTDVWEAAQLTTRSKRITLPDGSAVEVRGSVECLSTMHRPFGIMHRVVGEALDGKRRLFKWGVVDVLAECGEDRACRGTPHDTGDPPGPRSGDCPLVNECGGRAKGRTAVGHVGIDDAVRMKQRVAAATWDSEMLCLRPRRTDAVIPEFDPSLHVVGEGDMEKALGVGHQGERGSRVANGESGVRVGSDLPDSPFRVRDSRTPESPLHWIGGMDFGYRAPTAFLWGAVDPHGVVWVVDERVMSGVVLDDHIAAIRNSAWPKLEWIGVDPAGNQSDGQTGTTDVQVLRKAGFVVKDRRLSVREGLQLIRARLKPACPNGVRGPKLFVHRRCVKLIESLTRYHYDPDKEESETPVKDGFDHAVDALRYMIQNLDRPVRTVAGSYL